MLVPPTDQYWLKFSHKPSYAAHDFIAAPENREVKNALLDPKQVHRSAFLWGEAGCGKTHLASIWAELVGADKAEARQLDMANLSALGKRGLVVDGLENAASDEALFHLMNLTKERQSAVLFVSRLPLAKLPVGLPDLLSRLRALPSYHLAPLGDAQLDGLLTKLLVDRQIEVSPSLLDFVLRRIERSPAAIAELVAALDQLSLAKKRPPSRALVSELLSSQALSPQQD